MSNWPKQKMKPSNSRYSRYYTFIKPVLNNKLIKSYSFVIFSILTSTIFVIFAIQPTLKTITALHKSIDEQKSLLAQVDQKIADLALAKKNYSDLDPIVKTNLVTLIPQNPTLPRFLADINSLALSHQASISGLQFQPSDLPPVAKKLSLDAPLTPIDFTMNIAGSYQNLTGFLESLATFNHLVDLNTVNFNKPPDGSLIMTVNAKTYYIKN